MEAHEYIRYYEALASERMTYHALWQDIAENIFPRRAIFNGSQSPGQRVGQKVYDGTPMRSLGLLTSALHSMLTNPGALWFEIWPFDDDLMKKFEVRKYFQTCQAIQFATMVTSNFHSQVHEVYTDGGLFGNGFMIVEPDPEYFVRYSARPMSEVFWTTNSRELVDGFCRSFTFTARQMAQEFGASNCSEKVRKSLERPESYDTDKFTVLHVVRPREDFVPGSFNKLKRPYESVYVELDSKHVCQEGGYYEFPAAAMRFAVASGEAYGYGPGEVVLPDARQLHMFAKHTLRAAQKATDPALMVPHKAFVSPLRLSAGAINYYRSRGSLAAGGSASMVQPFPSGTNFPITFEEKRDMREQVERDFWVDQLRLPVQTHMTQVEIRLRAEENQRTLAPILGRSNVELLGPVLRRTFNILDRAGRFPPKPEILRNHPFKVKYRSPLARSQRYSEVQALMSAIDTMTPLIQTDPTMLEVIEKPKMWEFVLDAFGAPLEVIKDPAKMMQKIEEQEEQQARAQQDAMQLQAAEQMSGAIKNVASATKDFGGSRAMMGMLQ